MINLLDRPIWHALNGPQQARSIGDGVARRYAPDIGPLAAAADDSPGALRSLAALIPAGGRLVLLQTGGSPIPPGVETDPVATGVQMVLDSLPTLEPHPGIVRLTENDTPAMIDLAHRTRPGPFAARTHTLGTFFGIKTEGRLVAMAGERMKLPGYTEVSGVCTDSDHRGHGYGAALTHHVAALIFARNETPILHAYAANEGAIRVYQRLGFAIRSRFPVVVLKTNR